MASNRKIKFVKGGVYHIFSRSISGYKIFNNDHEYQRFIDLMFLLRFVNFDMKYSNYKRLSKNSESELIDKLKETNDLFVNVISYCIMPTHYHLLLEQVSDDGIEKFISKILNSYAKYFNLRHKRSGPLWSSRFKSVEVDEDKQLLNLTRYIHLNPTSAGYVDKPEEWDFSSYMEYISDEKYICQYDHFLEIDKNHYKKFVMDRKTYQRDLSLIKSLLIDDYSG